MTRTKLPDRRALWTQKVIIGGQTFYLSVGEYENRRVGEIWLTVSKHGTFTRGIADTLARLTSIALQNDTPIAEVVNALRNLNFPPNGQVIAEGSPVTQCTSVPDWIAQELAAVYLANEPEVPFVGHNRPAGIDDA